jgi:hypothetical protein
MLGMADYLMEEVFIVSETQDQRSTDSRATIENQAARSQEANRDLEAAVEEKMNGPH